MIRGWTGKRLRIDLSLQKAWCEDIDQADLNQWFGGRGLNAFFFSQLQSPVSPSSPENPIAFAVGPLTGTLAPVLDGPALLLFHRSQTLLAMALPGCPATLGLN